MNDKGSVKVRVKPTVPREEEGIYLKPDMGAIVSFLKESNPTGPQAKDAAAKNEQLAGAR